MDRRSPHLPTLDQGPPQQQLDQLQVEGALELERGELLKKIELPVEDISLGSIGGDVVDERVAQLVGRFESSDQPARLYEGLVVPATKELGRYLRLSTPASLSHLLGAESRGGEAAQQPDRQDRGRDRVDRGPVHRRD